MRPISRSPSPTRTYYHTTESPPENSPQNAPLNPATADDQNSPENPGARTGQTNAHEASLIGDRETSHPVFSEPATATNPFGAFSPEEALRLASEIHGLLVEWQLKPSTLSALINFVVDSQPAPPPPVAERGDTLRSFMQRF
jgi:hypothetical protein